MAGQILAANNESFEAFMRKREEAAESYVRGNAELVDALSTHDVMATLFGPNGNTNWEPNLTMKRIGEGPNTLPAC